MLWAQIPGDGIVHPEGVDSFDNLVEDAQGFLFVDLFAFDVLFKSTLIGFGDDGSDISGSDFFFHFQEVFRKDHIVKLTQYKTIEI